MPPTPHPLAPNLARIFSGRGISVGVGLAVDARTVLTCAHVVAQALGRPAVAPSPPTDWLELDLPLHDPTPRRAQVCAWYPQEDLALLRLDSPWSDVEPPRLLLTSSQPRGWTYGFPHGYPMGVWAEVALQGRVTNGQTQVASADGQALLVQPGFSGAPVWDAVGAGVIGLVVASEDGLDAARRLAWIIPSERLVQVAPQVQSLISIPHDTLTLDGIAAALERDGYTAHTRLALPPAAAAHAAALDFVGIQWSAVFGFTVGLVRGDGRTAAELAAACEAFFAFNTAVYRHPAGLDVPWLAWLVAFTLSGVVCVVFEQPGAAAEWTALTARRQAAPAYDRGAGDLLWVQTTATSLVWALDLPTRRIYKHRGKAPDGSNMHARWTVQHLAALEAHLDRVIGA